MAARARCCTSSGGSRGPGLRFRGATRAALLSGLLLLAGVGVARADELDRVLSRGAYGSGDRAWVREVFEQARETDIPAALLLPRVEEGVAKGVPARRLVAVLRRELEHLVEARQTLTAQGAAALLEDRPAWTRAANLLAAGTSAAELGALVQAARLRPADFRAATYLYVSLLDRGLEPGQAEPLVAAFLASRLPAEQFAAVPDLLARGRALRIPPAELARRMRLELPGVESIQELEEAVLLRSAGAGQPAGQAGPAGSGQPGSGSAAGGPGGRQGSGRDGGSGGGRGR